MRRRFVPPLIGIVAGTVLLFAGNAMAGVVGSKHDLTNATNTYYQTTTNEICVFCHTPHGSSTAAPLWNRQPSATAAWTMYSSPTLDMTIAGQPQGVSLACLSCHDGSLALDALLNPPNSAAPPPYTWSAAGNMIGAGVTQVGGGGDLSTEHPISITYDTALDADFVAPVGGKVGTLPLYGAGADQVECGSCHDPHDTTNIPFLRLSNAGSGLCLTCHNK